MSKCKISSKSGVTKWKIDPHEIGHSTIKGTNNDCNTILKSMLKDVEYAGMFKLKQIIKEDCNGKKCKKVVSNFVTPMSIKGGEGMSVQSPKSLCNYHTHPAFCYFGAGSNSQEDLTIWGWPSGEDMRESITFAMRNNLIHIVFALEGVYSIQVNPGITKYLQSKALKPNLRGMVICVIENYFKMTHGFRNCVYNFQKKNICTPYDWLTFANKFRLENIDDKTKERCTKNLSCKGAPNSRGPNLSMYDFLYKYDTECYTLSHKGILNELESDGNTHVKLLEKNFKKIVNDINSIKINGWNQGQWFKVNFSHNEIKGETIKTLLKKGYKTQDFYDTWQEFSRNPNILSFGKELIHFETPKVLNKGKCHLK